MKAPVILGVLLLASTASAQSQRWKAGIALIPDKSMQNCREQPQMEWVFSSEGNTFLAASGNTKLSMPMAADGSVKHNFRGNVGSTTFETELVGNAKTKQLEFYNITYSCRYRVVPK